MWRVLLAQRLDADSERRLAAGAAVVHCRENTEAALCAQVADCDALIARTHTPVTRAVLTAGERLKVVGVAGVGVDRVDLAAASEFGIRVISTPGAATDSVADLTLLFMLQLLRPVPGLSAAYRAGRFDEARATPHGDELRESTVGIVGLGRIGKAVGRRCAAGFGARVLYNDVVDVGPLDFSAEAVAKEALWRRADIVTLHVPLTDETRGLVDAGVFDQVRPTMRLINTARGAVVDTDALTNALVEGRIAGAALDVTNPEPLPPQHPLLGDPRCLVTPHIAARTHAGLRRMYGVVDEVLRVLGGK